MVFASNESSTPIYGNYHGYYQKRPTRRDPRLSVLPPNLFSGKSVLDIGCNEGLVTCEIAQTWGANKVVGVDIDDTLIRLAWRRRRTAWSLQEPDTESLQANISEAVNSQDHEGEWDEPSAETSINGSSSLLKRKRSTQSKAKEEPTKRTRTHTQKQFTVKPRPHASYFPQSCEHELGSLPVPPFQTRGKHVFPHNLSFRAADWLAEYVQQDEKGYDVILAFSISKWIHLNHGDDGLKMFFKKIYDALKPGGVFVLEPQPWDTYGKAKRMSEKLKENAKNLVLMPEKFAEQLLKPEDQGGNGFHSVEHFGVVGEGGFRRPVDLYRKPENRSNA